MPLLFFPDGLGDADAVFFAAGFGATFGAAFGDAFPPRDADDDVATAGDALPLRDADGDDALPEPRPDAAGDALPLVGAAFAAVLLAGAVLAPGFFFPGEAAGAFLAGVAALLALPPAGVAGTFAPFPDGAADAATTRWLGPRELERSEPAEATLTAPVRVPARDDATDAEREDATLPRPLTRPPPPTPPPPVDCSDRLDEATETLRERGVRAADDAARDRGAAGGLADALSEPRGDDEGVFVALPFAPAAAGFLPLVAPAGALEDGARPRVDAAAAAADGAALTDLAAAPGAFLAGAEAGAGGLDAATRFPPAAAAEARRLSLLADEALLDSVDGARREPLEVTEGLREVRRCEREPLDPTGAAALFLLLPLAGAAATLGVAVVAAEEEEEVGGAARAGAFAVALPAGGAGASALPARGGGALFAAAGAPEPAFAAAGAGGSVAAFFPAGGAAGARCLGGIMQPA